VKIRCVTPDVRCKVISMSLRSDGDDKLESLSKIRCISVFCFFLFLEWSGVRGE
jgi:hypothetical protein